MAEINKLIWGPPAPRSPLGKMDPAAYTHEIWELARGK